MNLCAPYVYKALKAVSMYESMCCTCKDESFQNKIKRPFVYTVVLKKEKCLTFWFVVEFSVK